MKHSDKKIMVIILARGGSKGVPGKNWRIMHDKPLIQHSYDMALKVAEHFNVTGIHLSTDSPKIKEVCAGFGFETDYTRPDEFATDGAGKLVAIEHLVEHVGGDYDYVLDLDVSSPIRTLDDIKAAFDQLDTNEEAMNIISVNECEKSPYQCLLEDNGDGFFELSKGDGTFLSRQACPPVKEMNGSFYIYKRKFFEENVPAVINDKCIVYDTPHICFDIDNEVDFEFMEYLAKTGKVKLS